MTLTEEIRALKQESNAVILAHNYQIGDVQDAADYVGDSLGLSQQAAKTDADVIVFCGVHFMAETAAILSPDKRVLIPDLEAGCSLAASIDAEQLRAWKAEHPGAVVVSYVNTTAEVKAESDYCCTSANAVEVVASIPEEQEVLFLPDMFLGNHVRKMTGPRTSTFGGANATCTPPSSLSRSCKRAASIPAPTSWSTRSAAAPPPPCISPPKATSPWSTPTSSRPGG